MRENQECYEERYDEWQEMVELKEMRMERKLIRQS